jgi:diphthamide synthase (EF-2-diphthine--ammonia ligase)
MKEKAAVSSFKYFFDAKVVSFQIFFISLSRIESKNTYKIFKNNIFSIIVMANKRSLKKNINLICADLFAECIAVSLYENASDRNEDNIEALLYTILKMQSDFICRVSHPEPGMEQKKYYKDLIEKFKIQVGEIVDQINNIHC